MIKLINILQEIQIKPNVPNNLNKLLSLQTQIKSSNSKEEKIKLAIECAELVLPIWNYYYPNDDRLKKVIEIIKKERGNYDAVYAASDMAASAANMVINNNGATAATYAAYTVTYASDTTYVTYANAAKVVVDYAIRCTKLFFKINDK